MPQENQSLRERQHVDMRPPRRYKVLIHNDDFTPMDFVVHILVVLFNKPVQQAVTLMLAVHHADKAVAGVYSLDIAASKAEKAMSIAKEAGYPLRLTYEPE